MTLTNSAIKRFLYTPKINRVAARLCKLTGIYELPINFPIIIDEDITMKVNPTSYLGKVLYYRGEDNFEYVPLFKHEAQRGGVFVDVGANIGLYSLLAFKRGMEVHSFEPESNCYGVLVENMAENFGIDEGYWQCYRKVVGDGSSVMFRKTVNEKFKEFRQLAGTHKVDDTGTVCVDTVRLDDYNLEPNIVKIDVEGHEVQVLKGARETISKHKPTLFIENNDTNGIFDELNRHGRYEIMIKTDTAWTPGLTKAEIKSAENLIIEWI